jgi:hypothetical protein
MTHSAKQRQTIQHSTSDTEDLLAAAAADVTSVNLNQLDTRIIINHNVNCHFAVCAATLKSSE